MDQISFLVNKALSRRGFLAGAGSVAAATALAGCADDGTIPTPTPTPVQTAYNDIDILNFALNLEYLEAEFYLRAATGSGLSTADIGSGTSTTGTGAGSVTVPATTKVPVAAGSFQSNIINELAYTEQQHVRALRKALGSSAVARPAIDLTNGFAAGATAANGIMSSLPQIPSSFSPFANFDSFVVGGFLFEDVGVTAYNGAAPLISTAGITAGYLAVAAGIMSVEAYHGGMLRSYLSANGITQGTTAYAYPLYANRLELVRAALGGGNETALAGFGANPTTAATAIASTVVPADTNALAYHRTTDQVLHIVYGTFSNTAGSSTVSAGVTKGGFFPAGLNGNISATQS